MKKKKNIDENILDKSLSEVKLAIQVSIVTLIANLLLSVFKLIAGLIGNSSAMVSDAVHSASDVFSTIIVMIGVKMSAKKADKNHPYGHERFESVAAIILSIMLLAVGVLIGVAGIRNIVAGNYGDLSVPTTLALVAAIVSIVVKEIMYWYTRHAAIKINSGALKADAWHHRSDALSSVGSLVGIVGAMLGLPIMDSIASIVICLFIVKAAVSIFIDAIKKMTDESCDEKTETEIRDTILENKSVINVHKLNTRVFGNKIYVDAQICLDNALSFDDAHNVAVEVHDHLEEKFPSIKHCSIQIIPDNCENNFDEVSGEVTNETAETLTENIDNPIETTEENSEN